MGEESEVNKMVDPKTVRLQYVKSIIAAMDSEFAFGEDDSLWVNDGQYQILLPNQSSSEGLIRFSKKLYPAVAADIASRFSGVANPMGLDVRFTGTFDPDCDSTGVVLIQTEE
jgi:hypothetical protein